MKIEAAIAPPAAHSVRRNRRLALMLAVSALGLGSTAVIAAPPSAKPADSAKCGEALPKIQDCLTSASRAAYRAKDVASLKGIADRLRNKMATAKGPALHYRTYWLAYTDYLMAAQLLGLKRVDEVRDATLEADTLLDRLENKDQESYALQDLVLLLRFAVTPPAEVGPLLAKTTDLKGRLTGTNSARGLYALALADFYTPKQYGGGRLAEGLLRQALAAPAEPATPLKPTWGHDQIAALLIELLKKKGANAEATSLYNSWREKYPDSVALAMVAPTS